MSLCLHVSASTSVYANHSPALRCKFSETCCNHTCLALTRTNNKSHPTRSVSVRMTAHRFAAQVSFGSQIVEHGEDIREWMINFTVSSPMKQGDEIRLHFPGFSAIAPMHRRAGHEGHEVAFDFKPFFAEMRWAFFWACAKQRC